MEILMMFGMIFWIILLTAWAAMLASLLMGMIEARPCLKIFIWLMIISLLATMAVVAIDGAIKWSAMF
ncbi:TPA: hypothetical protein DEX38_00895 [Candidatus Uhrbacteria bacterium]|nr:hypothetical protein [Candidatus Uhrbacteria bacterium]